VKLVTNYFSEANILAELELSRSGFKLLLSNYITCFYMFFFVEDICHEEDKHGTNVFQRRGKALGRHLHGFPTEAPQHRSTLNDALHSKACEPLSWVHRLRIALGVAQDPE